MNITERFYAIYLCKEKKNFMQIELIYKYTQFQTKQVNTLITKSEHFSGYKIYSNYQNTHADQCSSTSLAKKELALRIKEKY